ncbi:ferritin-like domain-containing protein [Pedobacter sp. GSP4]|uniref:ferritin-like domain-containing protein n=1 Tax=Pedobacter sp. GSP4 TaxID=3453716 RepID=UPI003EEEA06D
MKTHSSTYWTDYFTCNAQIDRIDWSMKPELTREEKASILKSLKAWQLAETGEGEHLMHVSRIYGQKIDDPVYPKAAALFIKEEQKHGANLGRYIDLIAEKRLQKNWDDSLFRQIRYFNNSMELWTITVLIVESAAQLFYQALKDATNCKLLKQICTDILIDEAAHIQFQKERLYIICSHKSAFSRWIACKAYACFFIGTSLVIWLAHRKLFKAGKLNFALYFKKMKRKLSKVAGKKVFYENEERKSLLSSPSY